MTQQHDIHPPESRPDDLPEALSDLNAAAQEIEKAVAQVEQYLEIRNLGVPAWVKIKGWDNAGEYSLTELGYDLFGYEWCIAIREVHGHENYPEETTTKKWRFAQSPRKLRISAVDKLPELIDEITKEARRTARRLREKTVEVKAFAESLKARLGTKAAKKGDAS